LPFFLPFFLNFSSQFFWSVKKAPSQTHTTKGKESLVSVRVVVATRLTSSFVTMTSPRAATHAVVELVVALFGSLLSRFDFDHQKRAYAAHILPVEIFEEERPKPFPAFESHEKKAQKKRRRKFWALAKIFRGVP